MNEWMVLSGIVGAWIGMWLRRQKAQERERAKVQNYLQGKAMLNAALQRSGLSEDEKNEIREQARQQGVDAGMKKAVQSLKILFTPSAHIHEKKGETSPNGVYIPPLTDAQYVAVKNLNTASQVAFYGVTAGVGAGVGAAIGFFAGGPPGAFAGAVVGAVLGAMWGAYEASCLVSVQNQFDKAYQQSAGLQIWRAGWAYNISSGGNVYSHINAPLSAMYVLITTFALTGKIP